LKELDTASSFEIAIRNVQSEVCNLFQYCRRVKVLVTTAGVPLWFSLFAAAAALCRESNNPYIAEPDPDSDA
jgi:hypothetical protein